MDPDNKNDDLKNEEENDSSEKNNLSKDTNSNESNDKIELNQDDLTKSQSNEDNVVHTFSGKEETKEKTEFDSAFNSNSTEQTEEKTEEKKTFIQPDFISFKFHGMGSELISIYIVNAFLTLITVGIYYAWNRVKMLQYSYGNTDFLGSRFVFSGTGREMFFGLTKGLIIFGFWWGMLQVLQYNQMYLIYFSLSFFGVTFLFPIFIHGSIKYRASRSSWRGVFFQYDGKLKELYMLFLKGIFYTVLTFGFYYYWLRADVYKYVCNHTRFGNLKFNYTGNGGDLLGINFGGSFLMYLTMGIYYFKLRSNIFNYNINNFKIAQQDNVYRGTLHTQSTGWEFFKLLVPNFLIILFTLGLGTPFAMVRTMDYYAEKVRFYGNIQFDQITQENVRFDASSTGEGMMDAFDLDVQLI